MELLLRSRPSPAAAVAGIAFRLNPSHEEEEEEEIGVAMAGSSSANAGMGWPLGLRSCMVAHDAASPRVAEEESTASIATIATAAQTSWLQAARLVEEATTVEQHTLVGGSFNRFLPYLSNTSVSATKSSEFDSDFQSETMTSSSFFKDSRKITLGSLIGLPMEYSASGRAAAASIHHHHLVDTHNHGKRCPGGRWSFIIANRSCGIRELLGSCGNCLQSSP
ncbi:unnamed protein product [Sphagnum troendelagicum]|uniref:Uncharacterized protein n=1 Tax=Sphagnum troendelagicum TaxID=128251 RepID=A0ABP0T926_9BRYO